MKSPVLFLGIAMCILLSNSIRAQSDSVMLQSVLLEKQIMNAAGNNAALNPLLFEKAMIYKQAKRYHDGFITLNRIDEETLDDSIQCVVHYEKALQSYMMKSFSTALQEIWSAEPCGFDKPEKRMLYLMILLENERWEDFKREYTSEAKNLGLNDSIFSMESFKAPVLLDLEKYERKSRIPGVGLIASGHTGKGLTNIALHLACAGFAVYQFYYGYYFTGFFSGVQPLRRFYNGGRTLTGSLVMNLNYQRIQRLKQKGYRYLQILY